MQVIDKAVEAVNGDIEDTPRFLDAIKALQFVGLNGPVRSEADYNWVSVNIYAFRVIRVAGVFSFETLATYMDVGPSELAPYIS